MLTWLRNAFSPNVTDESKRSLYDEAEATQRSYDPITMIFEIAKNLSVQQGEGVVFLPPTHPTCSQRPSLLLASPFVVPPYLAMLSECTLFIRAWPACHACSGCAFCSSCTRPISSMWW